jgi:glycosyltransferase involved in cell wall biosynthesis
VAKGVRTHRRQANVCYLETPMRFAWDLKEYYLTHFRLNPVKRIAAGVTFDAMRVWDRHTAARVDRFLAVSQFVAARCTRFYGRDSDVIYPPVDVDFYTPGTSPKEDFYLAASRLTPFKRLDLIVDAFRGLPDRRLVVIGEGPDRARIEATRPPNVTCLGYQSNEVLRDHMRRARAFLFGAPEDFGIVMAEAQACGTPVIALGAGGAREIVRDLDTAVPTGVFFDEGTPEMVRQAVARFEAAEGAFSALACRENALRFAPGLFRERLMAAVSETMRRTAARRTSPAR